MVIHTKTHTCITFPILLCAGPSVWSMAFRETKHSVLTTGTILISLQNYKGPPADCSPAPAGIIIYLLARLLWVRNVWRGKREERGRCSVQFGGAKGKSTLIFLLCTIEMVMQASCTFSTQINFSIWFWKEEGQKGFVKECKELGGKSNRKSETERVECGNRQ